MKKNWYRLVSNHDKATPCQRIVNLCGFFMESRRYQCTFRPSGLVSNDILLPFSPFDVFIHLHVCTLRKLGERFATLGERFATLPRSHRSTHRGALGQERRRIFIFPLSRRIISHGLFDIILARKEFGLKHCRNVSCSILDFNDSPGIQFRFLLAASSIRAVSTSRRRRLVTIASKNDLCRA